MPHQYQMLLLPSNKIKFAGDINLNLDSIIMSKMRSDH